MLAVGVIGCRGLVRMCHAVPMRPPPSSALAHKLGLGAAKCASTASTARAARRQTFVPAAVGAHAGGGGVDTEAEVEADTVDARTAVDDPSGVEDLRWVTYVLTSTVSERTYVGVTPDLRRRLRAHNGELVGGAKYTRMHRPWKVMATVRGFRSKAEAMQFEWAVRHCRTQRVSGARGRMLTLAVVLSRPRWTSKAPPAELRPLRVSYFQSAAVAEALQLSAEERRLRGAALLSSLPDYVTQAFADDDDAPRHPPSPPQVAPPEDSADPVE